MSKIKDLSNRLFRKRLVAIYRIVKFNWLDGYAQKSYAQDGEDLILRQFFKGKKSGFYVDVGAHHPKRFSNTYFFYKQGWRGINIDASPGSMQMFCKVRPEDINIEAAISNTEHPLEFFIFNESALNSFDKTLSRQKEANDPRYHIVKTKKITSQRLGTVLRDRLPTGQQIDFLSVDVEGLDLVVLQSNDWQRFRPNYVLAETMTLLEDIARDPVYQFLTKKGFILIAKTLRTAIFKAVEIDG